jgi:transglutaminase-like putative cysteine protease
MPHEGRLSPLAYLATTPLTAPDEAIGALSRQCLRGNGSERDRLYALARGVQERVQYQKGSTTVEDTGAAALARGKGVCQDQAHVFISCCRAAGIPARYVSGYLYSGGEEGGTAASHAWIDVWLSDAKAWLGVDVTHPSPAGLQHCRLAVGRDYLDAAPVRGVRRGGGHEKMDVDVTVSQAADQQ